MPSYMKHVYNNVILLQYLAPGANVKRKTFFIMSLNTLHSAFALHKRSRHINLYCLQPLFPVICCNISDLYRGSCCPPALVTRKAEFMAPTGWPCLFFFVLFLFVLCLLCVFVIVFHVSAFSLFLFYFVNPFLCAFFLILLPVFVVSSHFFLCALHWLCSLVPCYPTSLVFSFILCASSHSVCQVDFHLFSSSCLLIVSLILFFLVFYLFILVFFVCVWWNLMDSHSSNCSIL